MRLSESDEISVEAQHGFVLRLIQAGPVDLRRGEGRFVLGIGWIGKAHRTVLFAPSAPHGFDETGVGMAGEKIERGNFGELLPHEQQRGPGLREKQDGHEPLLFGGGDAREALAVQGVGDLVVILQKHDELVPVLAGRRIAVPSRAVHGRLAIVDESIGDGLRDVGDGAEIGEVTVLRAGGDRDDGVVEVVAPLGVEIETVLVHGLDHPAVVQIALGDDERVPPELARPFVERSDGFLQEVPRAHVEDRVNGVETQDVDVEIGQPMERVVAEVTSHLVRAGAIEVDRLAPGGRVPIGEVRAIVGEVVSLGAEVVVDDVERDGDPVPMGRVDEFLQSLGTAVARLRRIGEDAVVSPIAIAGELRHRHELDRVDAETGQVGKLGDDPLEGAFGCERPDVQLVQHQAPEIDAAKMPIGPGERTGGDDARGSVNAVRLRARARVRTFRSSVEDEHVVGGVPRVFDERLEDALTRSLHGDRAVGGADDLDGDLARPRRPDAKPRRLVLERFGAEACVVLAGLPAVSLTVLLIHGTRSRSGRSRGEARG